ncbi:MAG: hypothetical protein MJB12_14185 [Firmicutes bacterium]|nr:hypothetical protein [Bacillota bacterium]
MTLKREELITSVNRESVIKNYLTEYIHQNILLKSYKTNITQSLSDNLSLSIIAPNYYPKTDGIKCHIITGEKGFINPLQHDKDKNEHQVRKWAKKYCGVTNDVRSCILFSQDKRLH